MNIPSAYTSHRNLANAYRRGFQAGTIADVGGVPLAPYEKLRSVEAFDHGFKDGQRTKDGAFQLDPIEAKPLDVSARERELIAFLDQLKKDIDAVLHGGIR